MKIYKMSRNLLIALFGMLYFGSANAIPLNLVNIDAGINDVSNTIDLNLAAGTYRIEAIGTADGGAFNAWNAWGTRINCHDTDGCDRTGSKKYMGWLNKFSFASPDLADVKVNGVTASTSAGNRYDVNSKMAFPDELSALAHAWSAMFTINTASTISFMITDSLLKDNVGGISLNVFPDVHPELLSVIPEPPVLALFALAGLAGLGYSGRRKV
jgi:hypothetical protein